MTGRILALGGSPRRHGNSEGILDSFIEGVRAEGASVEKLIVVEQAIHPCRGCNACSLTGECVIRDRMQELYPMIDDAAAIVVATPVFFASVPGVLKSFYDRLQPYWARRYVLKQPPPTKRPGAFMIVRGGGDPYGFQGAVWPTKSVFGLLGIESVGDIKLAGVDSPGDLGRFPEAVKEARALGAKLAKAVQE